MPPFLARLLLAAVALCLLPLASAHGTAEANELEVEVLRDDENDLQGARGGWDIYQVFLGEAHDPKLGPGPHGDAIYWRADLSGAPSGGAEWRAVFTFDTSAGALTRTIRTTDGKKFTSDFDNLVLTAESGSTHIDRALIRLADAGLAPGVEVKAFRVETYVGDELRDRAPGGLPVAGPVEVPAESKRLVEAYTLTGPTRYVTAQLDAAEGGFALRVQSLLKKGGQHIEVHPPAGIEVEGASAVSVKANEAATFKLKVTDRSTPATSFDVTTDVGGRITLALERGALRLADGTTPGALAEDTRKVPGLGMAGLVGVLALALVLRRR